MAFRPGDTVLGKVFNGWCPGVVADIKELEDNPEIQQLAGEFSRCRSDARLDIPTTKMSEDEINAQKLQYERGLEEVLGSRKRKLDDLTFIEELQDSKRFLDSEERLKLEGPFVYQASEQIVIRRLLHTVHKKEIVNVEQIMKSTFRMTTKDLRAFYVAHEVMALWYKDRMTSCAILSVHPSIGVVNVVYFATLGYLSNLHFGTVLDNFIKYYALKRECGTVVVTALPVSTEFWVKLGYEAFSMTDQFARAYHTSGAVLLRNTITLRFNPNPKTAKEALDTSSHDAEGSLMRRVERSARSTIALRVLVRHDNTEVTSNHKRERLQPPPSPYPSVESEDTISVSSSIVSETIPKRSYPSNDPTYGEPIKIKTNPLPSIRPSSLALATRGIGAPRSLPKPKPKPKPKAPRPKPSLSSITNTNPKSTSREERQQKRDQQRELRNQFIRQRMYWLQQQRELKRKQKLQEKQLLESKKEMEDLTTADSLQ